MPSTSSPTQPSAPPVPSPSNPVLLATQAQWIFTDAELYRTPSLLDGMTIEAEHRSRSKGVNFITQVGILLKLPQLTLCTASVYLHRFFMRYSMVDLPTRNGMHPYSVAATVLFLATKVEENCRKMKELIIACCRVAQKQPSLVVDEQSKEYWKWRDTILHNEDLLLEALCFDLQLEQPYRLLYDFLCFFHVQDNKKLRNAAWAFVNDSTFTVLCLQFTARIIAASALYAAAKHCDVAFEDDSLGRPWWEQLDVDLKEMRRACNRMAEIYENYPLPKPGQQYTSIIVHGEETADKTRISHHQKSETVSNEPNDSLSPREVNGRKRERDGYSGSFDQDAISLPLNGATSGSQDSEPSPKRQRRRKSEADTDLNSLTSFPQQNSRQSPQRSHNATSGLTLSSDPPSQSLIGNPETGTVNGEPQSHPQSTGHHNKPPLGDNRTNIPSSHHKNSRNSRLPSNYHRQEHPLPPLPPVSVPPLLHQHLPRRESYGINASHKPSMPSRAATSTVPLLPPPPLPPSMSDYSNTDALQQRIDAIIQQGIPSSRDRDYDRDRGHGRLGSHYRPPPLRDRERDRDRDRDRDWPRDRGHSRRSSAASASISMSASLSASSFSAAPSGASEPRSGLDHERRSERKDLGSGNVDRGSGVGLKSDDKAGEDSGGGSEEGEV